MARSAGVDFRLEDFRRISAETPFISDLKPSGKYVMEDLHYAGGTPGVLKYMLAEGYLHGDCMTVTGMAGCEACHLSGSHSSPLRGLPGLWLCCGSAVPLLCLCCGTAVALHGLWLRRGR